MKQIHDFNFSEKTALVRCDFNVSLSKLNEIIDDYRIEASLATIRHLIKEKARVVLMSHFSGSKEKVVHEKIQKMLGQPVFLLKNHQEVNKTNLGDVSLLPNLRENKGEEENDPAFSQQLASLGDIYVNEAFSVSHREHASLVGIAKILPSCAGIHLIEEIKVLAKIISNPWRPLVMIVGGAKIDSKVRALKGFLELADHLLLGGKLVNEVLTIKRMIAREEPLPEDLVNEVKKIDLTSPRLHFPLDVIASSNPKGDYYTRITGPGLIRKEESIYDIGPETINIYSRIIKEAKMIVWAGPLGLFEERKFEKGTKEIARAVSFNHEAFKVVGGGDTGTALTKFNFRKGIDHISTGGGAMLEFLSGNELPALKALGYYERE